MDSQTYSLRVLLQRYDALAQRCSDIPCTAPPCGRDPSQQLVSAGGGFSENKQCCSELSSD
jgi:hypothetical protein